MSKIKVEKPSKKEIENLGIGNWSPWECEPSRFDWEYDTNETAYVLDGEVTVKTPAGEVQIKKGDLVHFPKGLKCTWVVKKKIRKLYKFGT